MLKFIFWTLLGANVLLLAYGEGYLGHFSGDEHEPARIQNQLKASQMLMLASNGAPLEPAAASGASATATAIAAASAATPAASAAVAAADKLMACTEFGNFVAADARRFETQVEALNLGERQSRHDVASQDISSYIVYIPPQANKEAADHKTEELKQLGVTNYFVISDASPLRWAISLGVFKTEAAAQNLLASLVKQGVHGAKVSPRYASGKQVAYQFRDLDSATKARLDQIAAAFPVQEMHSCK